MAGIAGVHIGAGSHCVLAEADETAAAGVVALAGFVEILDTAASVGLGMVADIDVLGTVGSAYTVAQDSFVVVAEIFAVADTAEWAEFAETVDNSDSGIVDFVDTAAVAGTAGLVRVVEVVDNAEPAAGTADTVAATECQPSLTAVIGNCAAAARRNIRTLP